MMTGFRKNCLPLVLTLVLCLGFATMSWAGPRGMGGGGCDMGYGCGMGGDSGTGAGIGKGHGCGMGGMQMTPDQAAKAFDLHQKFMNDTADVRKQMMVKRAELGELWRAKTRTRPRLRPNREISALRDQLQEKALSYNSTWKEQCPMMGGGKGQGACPMVPPALRAPKSNMISLLTLQPSTAGAGRRGSPCFFYDSMPCRAGTPAA